MTDTLNDSVILITGGSGTLGNALVAEINKFYTPKKVIIYSRNEYNQYLMKQKYRDIPWLRFRIGDIRDKERLTWCCEHVDYVVHAAAMKHISVCEDNPLEAIQTNIMGSANVVDACLKFHVKRALLISTDKSPDAKNLYGATKFAAEKLFLAANSYNRTQFRMIRYGNVMASRGSVIELFLKLKSQGIKEFPITDPEATRFWITIEAAAKAVLKILRAPANSSPIYIPRLPSMKMSDLARAIDPDCTFKIIGLNPAEKKHEKLCENYTSDKNDLWLTPEDARKMLNIS